MVSILIITIITFVAFLSITGFGLMKDFSRLWVKHSKIVFGAKQGVMYYSQLAVTLSVTLVIAVACEAFKGAVSTLVCLASTHNIQEFASSLRGTFSFTTELHNPKNHILMFFINPGLKLLCTLILVNGLELFFGNINKKSNGDSYNTADTLYFGSIAVILLIGIELLCHIQDVKMANMTSNIAYLLLDKFSYILFFLTVMHIKMLRTHKDLLKQAIDKYLITNSFEKRLVESSGLMSLMAYTMGLLLSTPYFLGLQWIRSNTTLITIFIIVVGIALLVMKLVFANTYNLLGTVIFSRSSYIPISTQKTLRQSHKHIMMGLGITLGVAFLAFSIVFPKKLFMLLVFAGIAASIITIGIVIVYMLTVGIGCLVAYLTKNNPDVASTKTCISYMGWVIVSIPKAIAVSATVITIAFMSMTCFPKDIDLEGIYLNSTVIDTNGDVLYIDEEHDYYYVPIKYEEIPEFFIQTLVAQEDRGFFQQHDFLPNPSNWNGLSLSMFKGRGGSNINSQIIKNLTFIDSQGFPRDLARKLVDQAGAYMLSIKRTPQQLLEIYANIAAFHGSFGGFKGLNASALYAFGKPASQLNRIQIAYLVSTLPRGSHFKGINGNIAYNAVQNDDEGLVKEALLAKVERWKNENLITNKDYNIMRNEQLEFTNCRYKPNGLGTGTRIRIEKTMKTPGRHISYITLENERGMERAYAKLRNSSIFQKNGAELMVACLVVDVPTGHIIAHYSSGLTDYTEYRDGFEIGSLGKPAIVTTMLEMGASPNFTLYDGKKNGRKTPKNANHGWSNKYLGINEILSRSLNAPFVNIRDIMNPKPVFLNNENNYEQMGVRSEQRHKDMCDDIFNYPLGNRQMWPSEIAQIFQTLMFDGICVKLKDHETGDTIAPKRIYNAQNVAVVKQALSQTVVSGTMKAHKDKLPKNRTYYAKTGTSTHNYGWAVLSDGQTLVVSLAAYSKLQNGDMQLGVEPLYGGPTAGLMSVYVYNELKNTPY